MNTIPTFMATDLIPLRNRGMWQGFGNLFYGAGSGLGGVFGGAVNDVWNWRGAFLVQVPFSVFTIFAVFLTVKKPAKTADKSKLSRVDFLGSFVLVISVVLLLLGLNSGGNIVNWNHPLVYVSLPFSGIFLLVFIYVEEKIASEPIIPVRLLLHRTVVSACLTNWISTMAFFGFLFFAPIYFQVRGFSATAAGGRLIPISFGTAIGSLGMGVVMRTSGKYIIPNLFAQSTFVVASTLLVPALRVDTPIWSPFIVFFLAGLGYAGMLTITLTALISAIDHTHQAVITSVSYAFRATGSTIGVAISSAVFQNRLRSRLWAELGDKKGAKDLIGRLQDSIEVVRELPEPWKGKAVQAYMDALQSVWITIIGLAALAALISLFMRQHVLHNTLQRHE